MIYFTSDTHFGHKNILRLCNRPFESIEEHDEMLIENWNEVVRPADTVFHLGDFAFLSPHKIRGVVDRLNPIESWNKRHHESWHLHGHCHGSLPSGAWHKRVDVGVDVWGYRPVSYEQIKAHMAGKKTKPVDHHGRE